MRDLCDYYVIPVLVEADQVLQLEAAALQSRARKLEEARSNHIDLGARQFQEDGRPVRDLRDASALR